MTEDIDFKPTNIEEKVDEEIKQLTDKIKTRIEIENNPPIPGEMKTEIPEGTYAVDLNTLLSAQIVDCPSTVIPMLIDHGVRTAVDIKETYKPEKRVLDFQYWWVIFLVIGLFALLWVANMMFGIFG